MKVRGGGAGSGVHAAAVVLTLGSLACGSAKTASRVRYMTALGVSVPFQVSSVGEEMAGGSEEQGWAKDRRADIQFE